ncbi:MAG TPA: class I SAM-dependent methyltransferase [Ktedonobacterales bacterium]|jgi:cyclopropane fatty-acyl-phospholipid synthase-like methyltransferase
MGTDESLEWSAASSAVYRQLASVAVPAREEQMATLLSLLPFGHEEAFRVVELASGEGMLSQAILEAFPAATVLALDGEESMRQATAARLQSYGERARVAAFDIMSDSWYGLLDGADAVVSSLCVHHLDGEGKRNLFAAVRERLSARGCLLLADLVLPQREEARSLFAATWDRSAHERSLAQTGDAALFDLFARENWNYYTYPDPFDQPSPLFDQLRWLNEAGFAIVDCFWMQAGHAIYGGYREQAGAMGDLIDCETALGIASRALGSQSS